MVRAFYCLFLFRDPSQNPPPSSAGEAKPDVVGVAFWGTRFIGGYDAVDTVLKLFEEVINDPSGNGTPENSEMANVNSEDKVVNGTNSWLVEFGIVGANVSKSGTWDPKKPGTYARNLITSIYNNSILKQKMELALKNEELYEFGNAKSFLPSIYKTFFDVDVFKKKPERLGIWAARTGSPYAAENKKFIYSIMKDILLCPEFWDTPLPGTRLSAEGADRTVLGLIDRELATYLYRLVYRLNDPPLKDVNYWVDYPLLKTAIKAKEDAKAANRDPKQDLDVKLAYVNLIVAFVGGSSDFCNKVPAVCTRLNGQNQAPPDDSVHNTISFDDNGK